MSYSEHFSIKNIPYGIATEPGHSQKGVVTRIHDNVVFLNDLDIQVSEEVKKALGQTTLNALAGIPKEQLRELRAILQKLLADQFVISKYGVPVDKVQMHLPVEVTGFTDFSCSIEHMSNAAEALNGTRTLAPGMLRFPIGYNGRPSTVVVSGTPVIRPYGQYYGASASEVLFGPSQAFDFELEVACVIGKPTKIGERVSVKDADDHIFGIVLVNDWSSRDIQKLEMPPLGPINSKSSSTSISPWIVTLEALQPFATAPPAKQIPAAPYLQDPKKDSTYKLSLGVEIVRGGATTKVCTSDLSWLYWTFRDMVAHQTVNGCNLNTGDLLASGTVSGSKDDEHGCLLESTKGGKQSIKLANSQELIWLQDGDEARLTGYFGDGVGLGDCRGIVTPAIPFES